jgi:hypothetical protein
LDPGGLPWCRALLLNDLSSSIHENGASRSEANSLNANISSWAGRALAAAIRARLGAVLHGVLAGGGQADSRVAHRALAVARVLATLAVRARVRGARGVAAIDAGLVVVLDAVRVRRCLADAPGADAGGAIRSLKPGPEDDLMPASALTSPTQDRLLRL